jgi:hypothetical protein
MNVSTWSQIAQYAWMLPGLTVWTAGLLVAASRWSRHPPVSALIVASLGTLIAATLLYRLAFAVIVESLGGSGLRNIGLYLGFLQLAMSGVRTVCYAAMIAAVLGWRQASGETRPAPLQFSIRGLVLLTLVVALLCGLGRAVAGWLGDAGPQFIQLVDDIPVYACLAVGIWLAIVRWRRHPEVSQLAAIGLGLSLAVSIAGQTIWLLVFQWSSSRSLIPLVSLGLSLIAAVAWVLILCGAFGWRQPDRRV